ncbi:MAG: methyltransferase domain-containing protein [Cyanobacteria bacterium J06635_15]
MANGNTPLFERFLAPVFSQFIDREALLAYSQSIDWDLACDRMQDPSLVYPNYYRNQNFHGIQGGYLTSDAAVNYDPITQYVLPPNETWIRRSLIDAVQCKPRRILDLGCGTGTSTRMLKRAFPEAEVIGLDLSPHMLVVAADQAQKATLGIQWKHALAEDTHLPPNSIDLITINLLFHETPPDIAQRILRECFRLLTTGGEVLVLDGNQDVMRQLPWLMDIFEEPYIHTYAEASIDAWMGAAGFDAVRTQAVWWIHQITRGVKPIVGQKPIWSVGGAHAVAVGC